MNGFEIARYTLDDALARVDILKDGAILPLDEKGAVVEDDSEAQETAREIRLLMQRILDLDASAFLRKMRELFFHLFTVDHEHFRDLMVQAAAKRPEEVRDFAFDFLKSEDILFLDDQETLHELIDALERLSPELVHDEHIAIVKSLWARPFMRLPSVQARLVKWASPSITKEDLPVVRRLFEMDWIPQEELKWSELDEELRKLGFDGDDLVPPMSRPQGFVAKLTLDDFERIRWMVGIDGPLHSLRFRLFGCMVSAGPWAEKLFIETSEFQPETVFSAENFETAGQGLFFFESLRRFRREIISEAHYSGDWFMTIPPEAERPWAAPVPLDPWPPHIRYLSHHWSEFADSAERGDFLAEVTAEFAKLDKLVEKNVELLSKSGFPSAERLAEAEAIQRDFLAVWQEMLPKALARLDKIP